MEYLLFLQNLRETSMSWLTPVLVVISEGTITIGPLLAAIVWFCIDKRWGAKLLFNLCSGDFIMNNIKVTACVNRPWIKDARLHVAKEVEDTALGYSFPSGHSTAATNVYGTIALWQRAKKWLVTVMMVLIVLTLFARNWLGAHTLADVFAAVGVGIITIVITQMAEKWLRKNDKNDLYIFIGILIICGLSMLYISFKPYPMEYLADGSLLVDPYIMAEDAWAAIGMLIGWVIAWFVERRFIQFSTEGTKGQRIVRGIVVTLVFFICYKIVFKELAVAVGGACGAFLRRFLTALIVCIFIPWCIKLIQKRRAV